MYYLNNNLYYYDNYDHLVIKLCSEFIMPIINITKKEHIKEYNEHTKDIIDNLKSTILVNIFINLHDNSNIDCNEKVESKIHNLYLHHVITI